MSCELRENSGSIFKNRKKEKETHPDWTGEVKIDGQVYWVSGWTKNSQKAGNWFSLSFKKKEFKEAIEAAKGDFSDEVPW